jgi:hypothetical protein
MATWTAKKELKEHDNDGDLKASRTIGREAVETGSA